MNPASFAGFFFGTFAGCYHERAMLTYPEFDPVAFSIGSWSVRWYGLSYLASFAGCWFLARVRARQPERGWAVNEIDDLLFYAAIGVVLGGRLGYALFYLKGIAPKSVELMSIYRGIIPFVILQLIALALVIWQPSVALWLPGLN